ncbi:uncharacterized protein VTP21DRAFT_6123 [Calcarisporiella thermophila]|uniref:uncharacterized protein n=1 Tax=Calcarisporiella thermophila TaxID=911321 RepID=UPI003744AE2F
MVNQDQQQQDKVASIPQLFGELERVVKKEEYEKAVKLCDKILKQSPNDADALRCKAVTLIRLEKYDEALGALAHLPSDASEEAIFEKAYCLYRTNRLEEAMELIKKRRDSEKSLQYLEAQVYYRKEDYQGCLRLYEQLLRDAQDEHERSDILTNMEAARAALLLSGGQLEQESIVNNKQSTYELLFNSAAVHLSQGDLAGAAKLLEKSTQLCKKTLSEQKLTQEEIDQEMAVILVQLAYVYQLQGRHSKAIELYQTVLKYKLDPATAAVANNNIVAASSIASNLAFDAANKLKQATKKQAQAKLLRTQRHIIAMNEALLALHMDKFAVCREKLQMLIQQNPDMDELWVAMAACTLKQKKVSKALEELQKYAKANPSSLAIHFAIMQLQLLQSQQPNTAIETLERYLSHVSAPLKPGVVAVQVWLYQQAQQTEKAMQCLEEAMGQWAKSGKSINTRSLLRQAALFKLRSGKQQEAAKDLEGLVREDPLDARAVAALIEAYAAFDPAKAEQYESALPEMESLMALDAEQLEGSVPGVRGRSYGKSKLESSDQRLLAQKLKAKRKKRKPRLPKNYDPNKQPDPERWLPRRERSTYKMKGKKKANLLRGSQGTAVSGGGIGGTGSANIYKGSKDEPAEEQQQQQQAPSSAASSKKKEAPKKKKKKGNKW